LAGVGPVQITIAEAGSQLPQLIRSVQAGDDVVISDAGTSVARLASIHADTARGKGSTILEWLAGHPVPAASRRSAEAIEAAIEAERAAWD